MGGLILATLRSATGETTEDMRGGGKPEAMHLAWKTDRKMPSISRQRRDRMPAVRGVLCAVCGSPVSTPCVVDHSNASVMPGVADFERAKGQ